MDTTSHETYPLSFKHRATDLMAGRFSCRQYRQMDIPDALAEDLVHTLSGMTTGPFGSTLRFKLMAARQGDPDLLKGLGTYGFIRNPAGFIAGAVQPQGMYLEDYGYCLELAVLKATDLGLGTCWLGGTFNKGGFASRIGLKDGESLPAVISTGLLPEDASGGTGFVRRVVNGDRHLPAEKLFFEGNLEDPLAAGNAGAYNTALQMVRMAPSASNKQPWRVLLAGSAFHFYLQRTPGYRNHLTRLVEIEDMQRLDMGIAMCHFKLAATDAGLAGHWQVSAPGLARSGSPREYIASWVPED